jgi:putative sigma-54 modulation protein
MQIIIQSAHFTPGNELINFVKTEVNKLSKAIYKVEAASVFLKLEKRDFKQVMACEIRLEILGNDLFVKKESSSFEAAATSAVDVLQEELVIRK